MRKITLASSQSTKQYYPRSCRVEHGRRRDYCKECRYDVKRRTGDDACPFNVFYWDFLLRNEKRFAGNNRMAMVLKNLQRFDAAEKRAITRDAERLRAELGVAT